MEKKTTVKSTQKTIQKTEKKLAVMEHVEIVGVLFIAIAVFMFCALSGLNVGYIGGFGF